MAKELKDYIGKWIRYREDSNANVYGIVASLSDIPDILSVRISPNFGQFVAGDYHYRAVHVERVLETGIFQEELIRKWVPDGKV